MTELSPAALRLFGAAGLTFLERGWLSSNCVLFMAPGDQSATLVDSGYWSHQAQTVALVKRLLNGSRLERIVNTHLHSDHCGGNAALQAEFGSRISVPSGAREKVQAWDESRLTYRATGQHCPRFVCDDVLIPGALVQLAGRSWRIVASPGHDPESIVLYDPELRLLISADALWEDGFGVVFPELEGLSAFADVRSTLMEISKLSVDWVLPGHGGAFTSIDGSIERALARLAKFESDPRRHAMHAAKVLIKFHLLEVLSEPVSVFLDWVERTPYFAAVYQAHFARTSISEWQKEILDDLRRSDAISFADNVVRNN